MGYFYLVIVVKTYDEEEDKNETNKNPKPAALSRAAMMSNIQEYY